MRGVLQRLGAGLAALAVAAPGCGRDPFGVPSRAMPTAPAEATRPSKATYLVYITPGAPSGELELWALYAQREANRRQAIFRVMGPFPGQSPSEQAQVVRRAVADDASALIVAPGGAPELAGALAEAEAKGVPVILIARSIPPPSGSKPFTVVEHGGFDELSRKVVEATLEDARKVGRSPDGSALIMVDRVTDATSARRVDSLKAAAERAGFRKIVMVPFEPTGDDSAKLALLEAVKANPDVSIVLVDDTDATWGAMNARIELQGKPAFFVGGYMNYGQGRVGAFPSRESYSVDGKYADLGTLAVQTALSRLRGESTGEHVLLEPRVSRGPGLVATADDLRMLNPIWPDPGQAGGPGKAESPPGESRP